MTRLPGELSIFMRQSAERMDLFQSDTYYAFLEETNLFQIFRYEVKREGKVVGRMQGYIQSDGGVLKRFFSRRAIINTGPFFAEDIREDEVQALLRLCINGLKGRVIYFETRNFRDYSYWRPIFEKAGLQYEPHYDFIIDTSDPDAVEERMGKSRKRDVKLSLKTGATIVDDPTWEDVTAFYEVLENLYKTRVKTPLFPLSFFEKLYHTSFSKFILVRYEGRIVGGTVLVYDNEKVYEWFACGKDGVYKNVYPSTVATYHGIRFAAENGFKQFDMMGAGAPGDGGYGVRDFKAKFGGELVEYGRFLYVVNKRLYSLGKWAVKLMKKKR